LPVSPYDFQPIKHVDVVVLHRLLDVLAGRTEQSGIKGTILVDGQRPQSNFKFMTGYVVQVKSTTMAVMIVVVLATPVVSRLMK